MSLSASQETQTSNLFKRRGKISGRVTKSQLNQLSFVLFFVLFVLEHLGT